MKKSGTSIGVTTTSFNQLNHEDQRRGELSKIQNEGHKLLYQSHADARYFGAYLEMGAVLLNYSHAFNSLTQQDMELSNQTVDFVGQEIKVRLERIEGLSSASPQIDQAAQFPNRFQGE